MNVCGKDIHVAGRLIRIGRLAAERYEFLADPEAAIEALRNCRAPRIDVFTFIQKLPHTSPAHAYALEWDNLAAMPVSTFEHWWSHQINGKTRNMIRKAENKGIDVRE